MPDNQRVVIAAYEAKIFDEKIQNKILTSKIKQKDKQIKILLKALRKYQSYCERLSFEICGRQNEDMSRKSIKQEVDNDGTPNDHDQVQDDQVHNDHVHNDLPDERLPKQLRSDLNPLTKYPRYRKEFRKNYCKKEKK